MSNLLKVKPILAYSIDRLYLWEDVLPDDRPHSASQQLFTLRAGFIVSTEVFRIEVMVWAKSSRSAEKSSDTFQMVRDDTRFAGYTRRML